MTEFQLSETCVLPGVAIKFAGIAGTVKAVISLERCPVPDELTEAMLYFIARVSL